uniref:Uncharacterized protein n=1 Tax=Arundo donax TaxID=35708 RepID=A0A0A8ZYG9_ARUDO
MGSYKRNDRFCRMTTFCGVNGVGSYNRFCGMTTFHKSMQYLLTNQTNEAFMIGSSHRSVSLTKQCPVVLDDFSMRLFVKTKRTLVCHLVNT